MKILSKPYLIENVILNKGSIVKPLLEEFYYGKLPKLKESYLKELTLNDLKASSITSELTKKYKGAREYSNKKANINTKLIQSEIVGNDILFKFLTEASLYTAVTDPVTGDVKYLPYKKIDPDHKYYRITPGTDQKVENPSATYELWIQVTNVLGDDGWLSVYDPKELPITYDMIKEILRVADVKLFSDDPSFLYQGFEYWLTQLDASIYLEDRKPRKWDKKHGDGENFLTKHFSQLIDQLPFFFNQMASSMTATLRKAGIISEYQRKKKVKESTQIDFSKITDPRVRGKISSLQVVPKEMLNLFMPEEKWEDFIKKNSNIVKNLPKEIKTEKEEFLKRELTSKDASNLLRDIKLDLTTIWEVLKNILE